MFHGKQYDRKGLRLTKLEFDVPDCVTEVGDTIRQEVLEIVRRNDDHSYVDVAVLKAVSDVDDVSGQQITSPRNLDLYADARNDGLVVSQSFDPINIAGP